MSAKKRRNPRAHSQAKKLVERAKSLQKSGTQAAKKVQAKGLGGKRSRKAKGARDSSNKLKVYSNVSKRKAKREVRARKKAEYLATLPKNRIKRLIYRMHPKRFFKYWFSRQGGIMALKLAGISFAATTIFVVALFAYFRRDLPNPNELSSRQLSQTTKFYDRTGETLLFEVYGDQRRSVVPFENISDYVKQATVAIEDKDFYEHSGFSLAGISRAALSNIIGGGDSVQGGSTITQQFIKNSLLSTERTFTRKIKELILSIELERLYTKDEILTFYLNEISYGGISYGIEAAAQSYFEKSAKDLSLDEAALLAAMPQAPGDYSPYGENTDLLIARQDTVLERMKEQGFISPEEAEKAQKTRTLKKIVPLARQSAYKGVKAPHFVEQAKKVLTEEYGREIVENGGLKVITTVDLELQELAEKAVKQNIDNVVAQGGDNAALSATDVETGQVLAQVGSRDFFYDKFGTVNVATTAPGRQPGSSFKPYGYAEMFKSDRWGPGSLIWDTRTNFGGYAPHNFDFAFPGKMKVREALGRSRNIPAVKTLYIAGVDNTIELARSMGNKNLCNTCDFGLSLILGSGEVRLAEHTHAYSTFARGGVQKEQTYILKVENAAGETIKEWQDDEGEQVLDPQIAYLVTNMLTDDAARSVTFGYGNANLVVPGLVHAVKTGTTDLSVDGWMMGYSKCLAAGVWVGNHDSKPMHSITSRQSGPIFTQFMATAHEKLQCGQETWERPEGIKSVEIDSNTGRVATAKSKKTHTDLFPSWYAPAEEGETTKNIIDKISNKLATQCTPDLAKEEVTEFGILPELDESDPLFDAFAAGAPYGRGGSASEKDDVHKCSDKLPSVSIDVTQISGGVYEFTATIAKGTHKLDKLNFKVNNQIVSAQKASAPGSYSYTHTFSSTGSKKITAEVIDSVLYENSNSKTTNVSDVSSPVNIISPSEGGTVGAADSITWDADPGANKYKLCLSKNGGTVTCITVIGTSEAPGFDTPATYSAYIEAYLGGNLLGTSPSVNFNAL